MSTKRARVTTYTGTSTQWAETSVILLKGEIGFETDTGLFKFGDGLTAYPLLPYANNIPTTLAELTGDTTHRTVTDSEKDTWNAKQNALTFDTTPTPGSSNPITSGGVYIAIGQLDTGVTGVKGNAESTYRTGNVNLSPADVGAVASNNAITGATKTKITYDSKGLVTGGADLQASDIPNLTLAKITDAGAAAGKGVSTSISGSSTDDELATAKAVQTAIDNLPEPMVFKGSLGTGGTITSLPTASVANEGFTYKVITAGTYAGQSAKVGDVFISNGTAWVLIPSGDEPSGTVTSVGASVPTGFTVSGTPITSSGTIAITFASGYSLPTTAKQNEWDSKANVSDIITASTGLTDSSDLMRFSDTLIIDGGSLDS